MLETCNDVVMFAGPTLSCLQEAGGLSAEGVRVLPPVRRGDLAHVVTAGRPGVAVIVDGFFHQHLSISHLEIRVAIEKGWRVWGLSSMGAIRAYEMRKVGMHGYGRVYRHFCQADDFRDDEVSLLHAPDPPYKAVTEPLVHIRYFLRDLVSKEILDEKEEKELLVSLTSMWYGERTLSRVRALLVSPCPERTEAVNALLRDFDRFRVKSHDLADFLRERPWADC